MKLLVLSFMLLLSLSALAQSRSCEMSFGGNSTRIKLVTTSSGALVHLSEEDPDQCVVEASDSFDLLVRCGSGDDATYFGVTGTTGRVFELSGTIAQLKKCRFI